ncbi:PLP-dependent aminotransferase family protein [Fodinicola feengrottensis]|uniref:PLP-dependent aminotransferase family protein n=1 Tax=Fodinicola feengrottensis TaxID=435914 RepID=A0ABN2HLK8_9ACTN
MPTSRELMEQHHVGPGTVSRAIGILALEGVLTTRPGSGTFVSATKATPNRPIDTGWQAMALADRVVDTRSLSDQLGPPTDGTIMLDGGYLHPALQPTSLLTGALVRAARRPGSWDRAPINGLAALRSVFATLTGASADDVLITAGGQDALSIAFRAIAVPGSAVLVESPTYHGALAAIRSAGLRPVPVPLDDDGLTPEFLEEAFALSGARLLYCQPTYHNPTGAVLSSERRQRVLEIARTAGAFVIEDDFARFLGHTPTVPPPLIHDDRHGTVVYITSLTKPAAPSFRIAAMVARGPVMERLRATRRVSDFFVSRPLQEAALELMSSAGWERHLKTLSAQLRNRCTALVTALRTELPTWTVRHVPGGGLHLWVQLPAGLSDIDITAVARRQRVGVSAGTRYFPAEPSAAYLRIGFGAATDEADLAESACRLAEVVTKS